MEEKQWRKTYTDKYIFAFTQWNSINMTSYNSVQYGKHSLHFRPYPTLPKLDYKLDQTIKQTKVLQTVLRKRKLTQVY